MEYITKDWLESKGFQKEGNSFIFKKDETEFGFDLIKGVCWIDSDNCFVKKAVELISEVKSLYDSVGFNVNMEYKSPEKENDFCVNESWLIFNGFTKNKNKWIRNDETRKITYDMNRKYLSIVIKDTLEGFDGFVKSENLMGKLINETFL